MSAVSLTCWIWSGLLGAMIDYREFRAAARKAGITDAAQRPMSATTESCPDG
jgi:hypothetical protein